ncbi:MAG: hypothetical protein LBH32_09730 [Dysgonamonadaceae bacterium]|jgi:hypothetical protein|nr:hypothetical protein [Dysgonamonadaceae bacterium]
MNRKILLLISVFFLICGTVAAQKLPGKCKVSLPEYIANTGKVWSDWTKDKTWQDWAVARIKNNDFGKSNTLVWKVYSDRANNKTYKEPTVSSGVHSTLAFMEQLNIADVHNGFALVYKSSYEGQAIAKDAQCMGWIPVDYLLLWEECPRSHSKIYQKALVVHDPTKHGSIAEKNPPFFMEPNKRAKVNPSQTAKDLEIYFVMKTEIVGGSKYYLLSRGMLIGNSTQTVYGWMPEEYITEWNQRLLIEPTHASKTVEYYKNKNISPAIFFEMDNARQLWTNEVTQNPMWLYRDFSTKRMHEYTMRNPILSKGEIGDGIFHVASISSVSSQKIDPELLKKIELLKQAKDNINVIFVIDATSAMKTYFQSVSNALTSIMKSDFKYPMKTGVVLYKNYGDQDKIAYKKITGKIDEISSFVASKISSFVALNQETAGAYGADDYNAMFAGLETALDTRKMGYESSHTNFVILIGNAGNRRVDPDGVKWQDNVTKLAEKMFDNRINFIAYQVNNAGSAAYDDFAIQTGKLQKELANKVENRIKSGELEYKLQSNRLYVLSRKGSSDELPVYDSYKYANSGQSETMDGLQKIIVGNVSDFQEFVFKQLTLLESNNATASSGGYLVEEKLKEILKLYDWNETEISKYIEYMKDGGTTKFIGYAPVQTNKSQHKLFDYVLFFSQNELEELIQHLSAINSSNVVSDAKAFQDAIVKMGQAMLGQFNEDEIRNMDMDKLLGQIYGIPVPINLCGLDIKKIPNMEKDDLKDYITTFRNKLDRLKRINSDSNYDGRFSRNHITYYWIPMEDMPGVYDDCAELSKYR